VGRQRFAHAILRAALRPDLDNRFGHDLDPCGPGGVWHRRSNALAVSGELRHGRAPLHPDVLNKGIGSDRPPSTAPKRGANGGRWAFPEQGPVRRSFGKRAGGPNAAQPDAQTVSVTYLRLDEGVGKPVAEKPIKLAAIGAIQHGKFDLKARLPRTGGRRGMVNAKFRSVRGRIGEAEAVGVAIPAGLSE